MKYLSRTKCALGYYECIKNLKNRACVDEVLEKLLKSVFYAFSWKRNVAHSRTLPPPPPPSIPSPPPPAHFLNFPHAYLPGLLGCLDTLLVVLEVACPHPRNGSAIRRTHRGHFLWITVYSVYTLNYDNFWLLLTYTLKGQCHWIFDHYCRNKIRMSALCKSATTHAFLLYSSLSSPPCFKCWKCCLACILYIVHKESR